jgi:glycosyltransferase involved in cell wall biosynthesis
VAVPQGPAPLVSVVVSHYNLGAYLPEALASLAAQTYDPLEVIVVDDGSTCPQSRGVLCEMEAKHPAFRFVRQENGGVGAARTAGLAAARGEYVVFFDADNVALPCMVEKLVAGMRRDPSLSALTCYVLAFHDGATAKDGGRAFAWATAFAGGPHVMACFENVYGDTNAILRVDHLRAVGGYENDRSSPWEDWMTHVKLANAGYRLDVLPEFLFHYRLRGDSRMGTMNRHAEDEYANTQGLIARCFPPDRPPAPRDLADLWRALVSFRDFEKNNRPAEGRLSGQIAVRIQKMLDGMNRRLKKVPLLHRGLKAVLKLGLGAWGRLRGRRAG